MAVHMATYAQLLKQFDDLVSIQKSQDTQRFVEEMYFFEETLNESREGTSLKSSELQDLDTKFGRLVEGVIEEYFAYKEQITQRQRERGETPPNETQVGECIENKNGFKEQYPGFRSIRGDGNCYYRAVMVGLIEQIIMSPDREKLFLDLRDKFERIIGGYDGRFDDKIIPFIVTLTVASRGKCWNTVDEFEEELRHSHSSLDAQMIQSARCLNAFMGKQWLSEDLKYLIDDDTPTILRLGQEAEGISIQSFPKELGIEFDLVWPQQHRVDKYLPELTHCFGDTPGRFKVSLLYTTNPGHYDLLYNPEQYHQLIHLSAYEPTLVAATSSMGLVNNFLNYLYHNSPLFDDCKKKLYDFIQTCPESVRQSIRKELKEGLRDLKMIGQAEGLYKSFFDRLRQHSEELESLFSSLERAASSIHRSSIFRPVKEDYRTILQEFLANPSSNQEQFGKIIDHLKMLTPAQIEIAMNDIHDKITCLKVSNELLSNILDTTLQQFDIKVLELVNPQGLLKFRKHLNHYVRHISIDPEPAREALLESIIMLPEYFQQSLHREVSNILISHAEKNPNLVESIKEEFAFLGHFISRNDSAKIRK